MAPTLVTLMNKRIFNLPDVFESRIEAALQVRGFSIHQPRALADAVLRLSNYYTENPLAVSPWFELWAQAASIAYYFPLNLARNSAVAQEANRLGFFAGLEHLIDMGSGMGPALFAFAHTHGFKTTLAYDISQEGLRLASDLNAWQIPFSQEVGNLNLPAQGRSLATGPRPDSTLLSASYVLTELEVMPPSWSRYEALAIVEPSTSADARLLMQRRAQLIEQGYRIWGPCTHEKPCPMLMHSERDWCHDRIHWQAPDWWLKVESHLPMKNRTLTFSYLLARKTLAPPGRLNQLARLTGDMLEEKGKTRISVCRSDEREMLAWFPQRLKKGESIDLNRGSLVTLAPDLERRSTELRLKQPSDVYEHLPTV